MRVVPNRPPVEYWFGRHRRGSMARAGSWAGAKSVFMAVFQVVNAVVLGRLLAPEDFGTVGLIMIFYNLATQLIGTSMADAIIQKADLTDQQASNYFWVLTSLGALAGICIVGIGYVASLIYGISALWPLSIVFGLMIFFDAMMIQYMALLRRALRFDILFYSSLLVFPFSLTVAIAMAYTGFGLWAIMGQLVVAAILGKCFIFLYIKWRPQLYQRGAGIRAMVSFGGRSSLGLGVGFLQKQSQILILGAMATPAAVGFYNRGQSLFQQPLAQLAQPISMILLPGMSRLQDDRPELSRLINRLQWLLGILLFPLIIFMWSSGEQFAVFLLGPQWAEAGEVMRWLALAGAVRILMIPIIGANKGCGRPARALSVQLALTPLFLLSLALLAGRGAVVVAQTFAVFQWLMFIPTIYVMLKGLSVQWKKILLIQARLLVIAVTVASLLYWLPPLQSDWIALGIMFALAYGLFIALASAAKGARNELLALWQPLLRRLKQD